jgi:hypothetical protein
MKRLSVAGACAAALAALGALTALPASAGDNSAGFHTSTPAMLTPLAPGSSVLPIISVGDTLRGYMFESIPDGISFTRNGRGTMDVYVNHETSLVPFPASRSDFNNAMVSKLRLNQHSGGVLRGEYAITSEPGNYQRFCSNFLVGAEHGFERELLFTNEEARDIVLRDGYAWHPPSVTLDEPSAEQAGVVVALDVKSGSYRSIYGMGRHNHENSVGIPGYGHPVVLSGDDTFSAPSSQLYLYAAANAAAVWNDTGTLYGFKSDDATVNDYGDLTIPESISGTFIPVPTAVAKGDQTALESWSNANGVFQFIRIEDIAYDRGDPHIVYFADTGEPRAIADPATGRLQRGPSGTMGPYPNGRIFRMVLNDEDPTQVDSLSVLIDADPLGPGNPLAMHQPDNLETTADSLLIQEDPGSHNQVDDGPTGSTARIWHYDFSDQSLDVVAKVNQSQDEGPSDVDTSGPARAGAWESSGIVDASAAFGQDWFLVDIQAGSLILESVPSGSVVFEREGGQLLAIKIPGA